MEAADVLIDANVLIDSAQRRIERFTENGDLKSETVSIRHSTHKTHETTEWAPEN